MKLVARYFFICALLTLILAACGGGGGGGTSTNINTDNGAPSTPNYLPHTFGSSWTYSSVSSGPTSTYTDVITQVTGTEFAIKETYQGEQGYVQSSFVLSGGLWKESKEIYADSPGNVTSYTAFNAPFPVLPSSIAAGSQETYAATTIDNFATSGTYTVHYVVNGLETVTVPAGTFANALKLTITYLYSSGTNSYTSTHTAWYADGVGNVKWVDNTNGVTDSLISYSIATSSSQVNPNWPVVNATTINTPTTWKSGNVYVINGYTGISVNAALTIEAGTVVKFKGGKNIQVYSGGSIIANGTAANPIIFTSIKDDAFGGDSNGDGSASAPAAGDWAMIHYNWNDTASQFNNCQFYYGGGGAQLYTLSIYSGSTATITNSYFAFNTGGSITTSVYGVLDASGAAAGTVITGNTFYANDVPIIISTEYSFDASNTFQNATGDLKNTYNAVFVIGYNNGGRVTSPITWSETEVPYALWSNTIENGGTLTLADNVVLKFIKGAYTSFPIDVKVGGTLNVGVGVKFTSIKDDSLLGDTNGDGSASTPTKGDWNGVYYEGPSPYWWNSSNILYATNP